MELPNTAIGTGGSAPVAQPPVDEDMLAMLGLHPKQVALAQGIHSGVIHPQDVLDAVAPKQPAVLDAPTANTPSLAPPSTSGLPSIGRGGSGLPPVAVAPPTRLTEDQAELDRLKRTGSGLQQFQQNHPVLGTIARIASGVGSAFFPRIAADIPGTDLHHDVLVNRQTGLVGQDQAEEEKQAALGKTQADTAEAEARARGIDAATAAAGQPKPKEEKWDEFPGYTDTDGTPLIREENSGQVVRANDKKPAAGFKPAALKPEKPDNPEQQLIDAEAAVAAAKTPGDKAAAQTKVDQLKRSIGDYAATSQRPEKPGASDVRADRSYTYNNDKLDKLAKPIEDSVARVSRLQETIAQGSPQADALVAPELLTIMAGGMGSGLRMNEAEISRVVGGRSKWQSLEASVNQWRLDPTKANSITPEQRQEIHALVDAVNTKLQKKQQALDSARDALLNSDDPKEHRRIVTEAHHALTQVDEAAPGGDGVKDFGAAPAGQAEGSTGKLPDGTKVVVKGGRIVAQ